MRLLISDVGGLATLSGTGGESPWDVGADDAAVNMLESAFIRQIVSRVGMSLSVDWDSASDRVPPSPDVWTDGSLVREVSGSAFAGAGVCARLHADNWRYRRWGAFL